MPPGCCVPGAAQARAAVLGASLIVGAMGPGAAAASAQLQREGHVLVGRLEHRVDAGYGVAASTGTVLGLGGRVVAWQVVEIDAEVLGGALQGDSVARGNRQLGEVSVRLNVLPAPWLAVGGVASSRGYEGAFATQRWTTLGAGAELRLDFAGGGVRTLVGATVLPSVTVSGQPGPDLGFSSVAGVQVSRRRLVAGADYRIERYVFPPDVTLGRRHEQLAGFVLRLGGRW